MLRHGVIRKALVVSVVATVSGCVADEVFGNTQVLTVVLRNDGTTNVHIWKAFGETGPHQGNRLEPGGSREVHVTWNDVDEFDDEVSDAGARESFRAGRTVDGQFVDLGLVTCSTPNGSGFRGYEYHVENPPDVTWNRTALVCLGWR